MGCIGNHLGTYISNLRQLAHEVVLCVQSTSRVDNDDVDPARFGRFARVECNGRRISALLAFDHGDVQSLRPDFQLFNRRRAKRVARGKQDGLVLTTKIVGNLGDARCFTGAVNTCDQDH